VHSSDLVEATARVGLALERSLAPNPLEIIRVVEDRELRGSFYVWGKGTGLSKRELIGEVVEAGPQVVDAVSDENGPEHRLEVFEPKADYIVANLRVGLDQESVAVAIRPVLYGHCQVLQVSERLI